MNDISKVLTKAIKKNGSKYPKTKNPIIWNNNDAENEAKIEETKKFLSL